MNCQFCGIRLTEKDNLGITPARVLCAECRDTYIDELEEDSPSSLFLEIQTAVNKYHEEQRKIQQDKWRKEHPFEREIAELCRKYPEQVTVLYECVCEGVKKGNHHFDYSRPFEVIRLCNSCHRKEHARLRA